MISRQTPERFGTERPSRPGWEFEQPWQTAWERAAEVIDEIELGTSREFTDIKDDDPLGSAKLYLQTAARWSDKHYRTLAAERYLLDDARTAMFEALIERGHLSTVNSKWDRQQKAFKAGSTTIRDLARRGAANPQLSNLEYNRRIIELHEEFFIEEMMMAGKLTPETAVLRISPYPQTMKTELARAMGYNPDRKKYMIRWIEVDATGERRTKQLSMSSSDDARLSQVLVQLGVEHANEGFTSEGILMAPVVVNRANFANGPADIARLIDDEHQFLGGPKRVHEDYDDIERNSLKRELYLGQQYHGFANNLVQLAAQVIDGQLSAEDGRAIYRQRLYDLIHEIASVNPEMAREVIGNKAAYMYDLANHASTPDAADILRQAGKEFSQPVYVCGMELGSGKSSQPEGLVELYCPEFKVGQVVTCPHCKTRQAIKSSNLTTDKLFCDNSSCKLARVTRRAKPKSKPVKPWFGSKKNQPAKQKSKSGRWFGR